MTNTKESKNARHKKRSDSAYVHNYRLAFPVIFNFRFERYRATAEPQILAFYMSN